jgi:hypothetical protein
MQRSGFCIVCWWHVMSAPRYGPVGFHYSRSRNLWCTPEWDCPHFKEGEEGAWGKFGQYNKDSIQYPS